MKIMAIILIGVLLTFNIASAGIEFTPKDGKLRVKASGELTTLKSTDKNQEYFAVKLEDNSLYVLTGERAKRLNNLLGKKVEIDGLLKASIVLDKKSIPNIEAMSVNQINKQE